MDSTDKITILQLEEIGAKIDKLSKSDYAMTLEIVNDIHRIYQENSDNMEIIRLCKFYIDKCP